MGTRFLFVATLLCVALLPGLAQAQDRMPPIAPDQYSDEQKAAAAEFQAARKAPVFGPFAAMMRSPEVMNRARAMGDYLRYKSAIGNVLSELAILITAREYSQIYEWSLHAPIAEKAGIKPEIVAAIADGRRPEAMSDDEAIVYDFSTELYHNKRVSDDTYARALKRFGDRGVVDLISINGYYTFLAMFLNTSRLPPAKGGPLLQRFPE